VTKVALSADAKIALIESRHYDGTKGVDKITELLETSTGKPIAGRVRHQDDSTVLALSPDGKTILTGRGNTAQLYEAATGKPVGIEFKHRGQVTYAAFSADGKTLLTVSGELPWSAQMRSVHIWTTATGEPIGPPLEPLDLTAVAFSADGKTVRTASPGKLREINPGTIRKWDVATGKPVGPPLQLAGEVAFRHLDRVAFAHGDQVLTERAGDIQVFGTITGKPIGPAFRCLDRHKNLSRYMSDAALWNRLALSRDGRFVLTAFDRTARVWEVATGKPIGPPLQHQATVMAIAFSLDGKTVLTGSGFTARLWQTGRYKPIGPPLHPTLARYSNNLAFIRQALDEVAEEAGKSNSEGNET
jgi:WD40 repeat protein